MLILILSMGSTVLAKGDADEIMKKLFSAVPGDKAAALQTIEKERPPQLVALLTDTIRNTRELGIKITALEALKKYPVRTMISFWMDLLKSEDAFLIKKNIIDFVSQTSDRRIVIPLVEELSSPFSTVRNSAILALKRLGDDRMFPAIFNMARNPNPIYRVYALEAIYHLYDRRMATLILEMLTDENKSVRYYALKCIERNRLNETIFHVRNIALNDRNWEVRIKAIEVIREFRDMRSLYVLVRCLSEANRDIRYSASLTLLEFRNNGTAYAVSTQLDVEQDDQIKEVLLELLIKTRNAGGFRGLERVLLNDLNPDLRIKAAYALGVIGNIQGIPLLLKGLSDKDFRIRAEVSASMGHFRNNYSVLTGLLDIVDHDDRRYVRSAALFSLQKLGDRRALVPLYDLYGVETDPLFREQLKTAVRTFIIR